jgi:hypothetical protein
MRVFFALSATFLLCTGVVPAQTPRQPIIDVHVHAGSRLDNLRRLESKNIPMAVLVALNPEYHRKWIDSSKIDFIASLHFPNGFRTSGQADSAYADNGTFMVDTANSKAKFVFPDTAWIRSLVMSKQLRALGEITAQYWGMAPSDPRLEPYFALAEELDIPVGIHMALAPPNETDRRPTYRSRLGNPLLLEDVLVRHPKLRIWVMHAGHPYLEEMTALMLVYSRVYIDISAINVPQILPRVAFQQYLKGLIDAGLGKRIMFGSDFTNQLDETIEAISTAQFLSEEQKRDIFYNNAARFLRLTREQVNAHTNGASQ